jgi:hypothetical protein
MHHTAILTLSDGTNTETWIGAEAMLTAVTNDRSDVSLTLTPTRRLFSAASLRFIRYRVWQYYADSLPVATLHFYRPRRLRELLAAYHRLSYTLEHNPAWHPLHPYTDEELLCTRRLRTLILQGKP